MTLQNRVDPFGAIHADPARGGFTGNRGIIHDPARRTLLSRRWTTKAWICCRLDFPGRKRNVMATRSWTELFFLDEATALSAGHRPCFFCRRKAAEEFRAAWTAGNGTALPRAAEMDAILHRERLASGGQPRMPEAGSLSDFPDGTMLAARGDAYLLHAGSAHRWSFAGYDDPVAVEALKGAAPVLLTPPSIVAALRAGYRPQVTLADAEPRT